MNRVVLSACVGAILGANALAPLPAFAAPLDRSGIAKAMLGKTITTRRFGMRITMRYRRSGSVSASSLLGTTKGTWRYSGSNKVCTTFPSGPAKGTQCVSFTKIGANRYRSSAGVTFTAR